MKQTSIPNNHQVGISDVYLCGGLFLCVAERNSSLVVWNPYLGQTRWIRPKNRFHVYDRFALGYDNNNRNHKIVRFLYDEERFRRGQRSDIDIYDFSSDSWRLFEVNPDGDEPFYYTGVSLKGNTYFFGQKVTITDNEDYLLCFDFTTERFGPRLPLPFNPTSIESVIRSWVRDEKLAVLYNHSDTIETYKIWISTKIEPNAVSWRTFLTVSLVNGVPDSFRTYCPPTSFVIDEEKKVAVLFNNIVTKTGLYKMAYIVGDGGYFKSFNIGEVSNYKGNPCRLMCSSYVPSLVQLQV